MPSLVLFPVLATQQGWLFRRGLSFNPRGWARANASLLSMAFNVFIDWLIGLVPLIGDIFDIGWKGNLRNVSLLRREFPDENGSSENGIQANGSDRAPIVKWLIVKKVRVS